MIRKFKITYTEGDREATQPPVEVLAASKYDAKSKFYHKHPDAEIVRVEEVTDNDNQQKKI